MKETLNRYRISRTLLLWGVCIGVAGAANINAQSTRSNDTNRQARSSSSASAQQANAEGVRVTRASYFLGSDVIATDEKKVGDIVDYYFDFSGSPHLAYVVVMTGGFLDLGGDRRAVPAAAITTSGDNCRINISSERYWDVPVLPENSRRFVSDAQNRQRISQIFAQAKRTADAGSSERSSDQSQASNSTAATEGDDADRAGAPTGRAAGQDGQLVSFNELRNADAYGQQDTRLGFFVDAWVNLNDNRAPYIEITPTYQPFRTSFDRRYAIPTAKLAGKREYYGYTVDITPDELNQAEPVSETEGVKMLQEGRFGNTVLRVTVPEK